MTFRIQLMDLLFGYVKILHFSNFSYHSLFACLTSPSLPLTSVDFVEERLESRSKCLSANKFVGRDFKDFISLAAYTKQLLDQCGVL